MVDELLQYHEVFGQWHMPDVRASVPHERGVVVVKTNSLGMRSSREYQPTQPPGITRILLFGDSYTAGEGVDNDERFSDLLERQVDGLEVLNFGLNGSGTDQQWLIFERLGDRFGGDLILFCPQVENIRRVTLPYWPMRDPQSGRVMLVPKPYATLEDGRLVVAGLPVPRRRLPVTEAPPEIRRHFRFDGDGWSLRHQAVRLLGPLTPTVQRLVRYQPYPQYDSPRSLAWRLTVALLERLLERAGSRAVVIAPLPNFYYIERRCPPAYLVRYREFAESHPQVHVVDLLPDFLALSPAERRQCRFRGDVHYSPFGHRVVAGALLRELAALGLLHTREARPSPVPPARGHRAQADPGAVAQRKPVSRGLEALKAWARRSKPKRRSSRQTRDSEQYIYPLW